MSVLLGYRYSLTGNEIKLTDDRNYLNANAKEGEEQFAEITGEHKAFNVSLRIQTGEYRGL
jgi:hypothetical protein